MSVDRDERERDRSPEKQSDFKVFVGGISWHTTDQELADSELLDDLASVRFVKGFVFKLPYSF